MVFKFKELNQLFRANEVKFLDFLYNLKVTECKRTFKDVLFFYMLSEIHKELKKNKDVIFYINLKDEPIYKGLDFFDEGKYNDSLQWVYKKVIKLMPNKVFETTSILPETALLSDLTPTTLDSIFIMLDRKFNFQKLLKVIDAKIFGYKNKFDLSSFYF